MSELILWASLAWRNVWRNLRRSLLTMGIVAVASMALLTALGFILASFEGVKFSIVQGGAGHFQIARLEEFKSAETKPAEFGTNKLESDSLVTALNQSSDVRKILPRLSFQGLISNGENTRTFSGEGIEPQLEWQAFGKNFRIVDGDYFDDEGTDQYSILLGKQLAERLHAKVGDSLTLVSAAATGQMNAMDVTLKGVVSTGIAAKDSYFLSMPLKTAQELVRTDKISRTTVLLKTSTLDEMQLHHFGKDLPKDFQLKTWRELNPIYDQLVTLYKGQFIVLGSILLLVAFLSILNTIIMNVMERSREIGTLRAIGIDSLNIRLGFVFESLYICISGALLGALIAFILSYLTSKVRILMPAPPGSTTGYPLQLLWSYEYAAYCILTLSLIGIVAAWFASRYVAKLSVVDAINSN